MTSQIGDAKAILISITGYPDKGGTPEIKGLEGNPDGKPSFASLQWKLRYLGRQVKRIYKKGFYPRLKVHNKFFTLEALASLLLYSVSNLSIGAGFRPNPGQVALRSLSLASSLVETLPSATFGGLLS